MLRYILLKLPGFTSKTDFSISSSCNHARIFRSVSPVKREFRRELRRNDQRFLHKRSNSFPSARPKSERLIDKEKVYSKWRKSTAEENEDQETILNNESIQSNKIGRKTSAKIAESERYKEHAADANSKEYAIAPNRILEQKQKLEENKNQVEIVEQYELEAAKPRRSRSELVFNVFEYIESLPSSSDATSYLQPNNLRPFGSNDNIYFPLNITNKSINPIRYPHDYVFENLEPTVNNKNEKDTNDEQRREYSTVSNKIQQNTKHNTLSCEESLCEKNHSSRELKSCNEIIKKHKALNPSYISKKLSPTIDEKKLLRDAIEVAEKCKRELSDSKNCSSAEKCLSDNYTTTNLEKNSNQFVSYKLIKKDPATDTSNIINTEENQNSAIRTINLNQISQTSMDKFNRPKPPWPAFSESAKVTKTILRNSRFTYFPENFDVVSSPKQTHLYVPKSQTRNLTTENIKQTEELSSKNDFVTQNGELKVSENVLQKRALSTEHLLKRDSESITSALKTTIINKVNNLHEKSSGKISVSPSTMSLNNGKVNIFSSNNYGKASKSIKKARPLEPESCEKPKKPIKYFLPSKVRLKPPECLTKPPYRDCIKGEPCPPRADQCLNICPKKLPVLEAKPCPCIEPEIPKINPKLQRLKFKFEDQPRVCPCSPCPCPPRSDDFLIPEPKKLLPLPPNKCDCIDPPPMVDVPLMRLKKICEPEDKCYSKKECPSQEPCVRADDILKVCPKELPILKPSKCPCIDPVIPHINPLMQRLKFEFKDPPRICPCAPTCPCPPRADDNLVENPKGLPILKLNKCVCINPPRMTDVPLKKLKKVCPPEVCHPKKECPVETCEDKFRADDCLHEKCKKLPKLQISDCPCVEPYIPDKSPSMKRLKMEFKDEPRVCPCKELCPCPPRADEYLVPKHKTLHPYIPQECKCIDKPSMIDIPLIRLKKVCEPKEKCHPKRECPVEIPCKRSDEDLCKPVKPLPKIEPKTCPCVETKMKDTPKLKRLTLKVPEPVRVCPTSCVCGVDCPRADDNLPPKCKTLPILKTSICPCVDQPMIDVKPLPRLKCEDEEPELVCEDPCIPFPRADWGCWEYTQNVNTANNNNNSKAKTKAKVNCNPKRKFNTDSRLSINEKNISCKPELNLKFNRNGNSATKDISKVQWTKSKNILNKNVASENNVGNKKSPGKLDMQKFSVMQDKMNFRKVTKLGDIKLRKNNSSPTIILLKQLSELENKRSENHIKFEANSRKKNNLKTILYNTSRQGEKDQKNILNVNARKLTPNLNKYENLSRPLSMGNIRCSSETEQEMKCKKKEKIKKPTVCHKLNDKCAPVTLKGCPPKSQVGCNKERTPVCCEKKPPPYPAFSECMDEEVEPYSNITQWTCNRPQYGFEPNPKKLNEPLDTVKNKKKFSTIAARSSQNFAVENNMNQYDSLNINSASVISKNFNDIITTTPLSKSRDLRTTYGISGVANDSRRAGGILQLNSVNLLRPRTTESLLKDCMSTTPNYRINSINRTPLTITLPKKSSNMFLPNQITCKHESNYRKKKVKCDLKPLCEKKQCPKFKLENCPSKARETCKTEVPVICEKSQAPYPSFTDCMDDELEEQLAECPLEKEKVRMMQPKHMNKLKKPNILEPHFPRQGKIDPKLEEECIRSKLCIKKQGLTQDCSNFGKFIKPMRSKDYIKEKNKDCERIKELKKLGKWPPKNMRKFCTNTSNYFNPQTRNICTLSPKYFYLKKDIQGNGQNEEKNKSINTSQSTFYNTKSNNTYSRNYHALCKNPETNVTEEISKETSKYPYVDTEEPCKYMKLKNVHWRINNFQKWQRMNKLNNFVGIVKRYHTFSINRYKRYLKYKQHRKKFSTSSIKNMIQLDNADSNTHRGISTTMMLSNKNNKCSNKKSAMDLKVCPKIKLRNCPARETFTCKKEPKRAPCHKIVTPYPAFSECYDDENEHKLSECPFVREQIKRLQPQYPVLPEIEITSLPPLPYQGKIDPNLKLEYIRRKLNIENEGLSQDCQTFGESIKLFRCESFEELKPINKDCIEENKKQATNKDKCKDQGQKEVFFLVKKDAKQKKNDECELKNKTSHENKKSCEDKIDKIMDEQKSVCTEKELSLWQKIVKYFQARPNCPAPDEWKKKALREKAEKAAKAAGLCLYDPVELQEENICEDLCEEVSAETGTKCGSVGEKDDDCDSCDEEGTSAEKVEQELDINCISSKGSTKSDGIKTKSQFSTFSKRFYSKNVNVENIKKINESVDENEETKSTQNVVTQLTSETKLYNENDDDFDNNLNRVFENIFMNVVFNKNELNDITGLLELEKKDDLVNFSVKISRNFRNDLGIIFSDPMNSLNNLGRFNEFQEYFSKNESLPEISQEEIENAKTKNLVKELDKLLEKKKESNDKK